ncbi:hypothetical protein [Bradyrhizobium icense]|uniref:Uncharacterized protein n=1 Tax=Bradyrhizobium icense TaxID=1274631 RepID=A0A1B1UC05_9BRAD|nr:hypothetical protein [Bradyrhizobium icense]ANW00287.1 hypothetical protein LMTR13_09000 [Bradyrhizobium icense]
MDQVFFREQALRARVLAEKADPFTRKRFLNLADMYDAKAGGSSRASRLIERPLQLPKTPVAPTNGQSGEA